MIRDPVITGKPFNDAYRYMDWLLTVPLLLIEIIFVCKLSPAEVRCTPAAHPPTGDSRLSSRCRRP